MKTTVEIKNRRTNAVMHSVEIECREECSLARRIGLAVIEACRRGSNLRDSNLRGSDLSNCNLSGSDLRGCDLRDSNLSNCNLSGSNLRGCNLSVLDAARLSIVPERGEFAGVKQCRDGVLVWLRIPADARRSNATGRKCRAEFAEVIDVVSADCGVSRWDSSVVYRVGETVRCHEWCENRWQECAGGIHFYLTEAEARAHR